MAAILVGVGTARGWRSTILGALAVAFIVVTFGAEANQIGTAVTGALAALVAVGGVAFLTRRWISHVPRQWLRFAVGIVLAAFGTFWAAEGLNVRWPGSEWSLVGLLAGMTAIAFAYLALLRSDGAARIRES